MGKCVFNRDWPKRYPWVKETSIKSKAHCVACMKDIDIGQMGESALKSHCKGDGHKKNEKARNSTNVNFFAAEKKSASSVLPSTSTTKSPPTSVSSVSNFFAKNDVLRAEIIWTLQTIVKHASYKSNENINLIFQKMFPDSEIGSKFALGERKTSYLCVFGIAEHFKSELVNRIKGPFVALFDESLNKKMQEKQMDLHIRYWDSDLQQVVTRYFGSEFLGHAKATDLVTHFKAAVDELNLKDLIQISMDGPAVNLKFHKLMQHEIEAEYSHSLVDIGSCGLHILHNSFKGGATESGWDVESILSSLYYLFKDAPSRKSEYKVLSGVMPLKFVSHRWLENVPVCERAMEIWETVASFVDKVESKEIPKPDNKSYKTVRDAVKDKLTLAKIEFFCSVAKILQPFLEKFQTDKPMVPFLSSALTSVLRCIMRKFIKPSVLDDADTSEKLLRIDEDDNSNHVSYSKVDIGLKSEARIKSAKVSERQILEYRMQSKSFLIKTLKKMKQKCPIVFTLVRNMGSLDPAEMQRDKGKSRDRFRKVVKSLLSSRTINEADCDQVLQQYDEFLDNIPEIGSDKFLSFDQCNDRVDDFFVRHMTGPQYELLLKTVKILLTLSHGQATVERGFSVNKEVEVENMSKKTLVAQRLVYDHVKIANGVLNVPITNKLLVSAANARQKYETYLGEQRQQKKTASQQMKRKSTLDEIEDIKRRKVQVEKDHEILLKTADDLCIKAENSGKLELLAQANSNRKRANEKLQIAKDLAKELDCKLTKLRNE